MAADNLNLFRVLGVSPALASVLDNQIPINPPPPPPKVNPDVLTGTWTSINSYKEASMLSAPVDGTPTIGISPEESKLYFVQHKNGRTQISTYKLVPDVAQENSSAPQPQPQQQVQQNTTQQTNPMERIEKAINNLSLTMNNLSNRLNAVEGVTNQISQVFGEMNNESTTNIQQN